MTSPSAAPITRHDLIATFERATKPAVETHRIGTELECFGVREGPVPRPVRFREEVEPILGDLCRAFGWRPGPNRGRDGEVVELVRDGASITLEPGCQLELSGAPLATLDETCREITRHARELAAVSTRRGVRWIAAGFHPFAAPDEIDWVPKARYDIMRRYLPQRGPRALDMMTRTCTIQANFDYGSERDCGRRLFLAFALGPVLTAMFANSPYEEGRFSGFRSLRMEVWFHVDPDRCGIPPFALDDRAFTFERYVDWALDVPMFFIVRDGRYIEHHGTFRAFLETGLLGPDGRRYHATYDDWLLHLSTLFPNVRLKPYVEVRTTDAVPRRFACALPALWKGLLYDEEAQARAYAHVADRTSEELAKLWCTARHDGLRAPAIRELAADLVETARAGLSRLSLPGGDGRDESRHLAPLVPLVERGTCPADDVLACLGEAPGTGPEARRRLVEAFRFTDDDGGPDAPLSPP